MRVIYRESSFLSGIDREFLISDPVLIKMKFISFELHRQCIDLNTLSEAIIVKDFFFDRDKFVLTTLECYNPLITFGNSSYFSKVIKLVFTALILRKKIHTALRESVK